MPGFLRHARDFAAGRRATPDSPGMSRLYAIESTPSISGANADHRRHVAADELTGVVAALAEALGLDTGGAANTAIETEWIGAVAEDLRTAGDHALVVAGGTNPETRTSFSPSTNGWTH